jgi:hypothetical protein
VLHACRQVLVESPDADDEVTVRADLLHLLARPYGPHDQRR